MKALAALPALLLLGATGPVSGASFSCSGRPTPTEAAICADPELAAWDRAQARVYRRLDRTWEATTSDQRGWLRLRDACGADRTCLIAAYRKWPGFGRAALGLGVAFERHGSGRRDPAWLNVMPIYGKWHYFSLTALHQQTPDPGSTNTGVYAGIVELKGNVGTYDEGPEDFSCRFHLRREGNGWDIQEFGPNSQCGGLNVIVSGFYGKVKSKVR